MDLSIVIPTYNESKKIARDVEAAAVFLNDNQFAGQIIIVDDGSKDNTADAARSITTPQNINVQLAPCQNPLTVNVIKIFRIRFTLLQ